MSRPEWQGLCRELAEELRAACAYALKADGLLLDDQTAAMWAQEEDPQVPPHHAIGLIYRYRVREIVTRHLFGWKRLPMRRSSTLAAFGLEEMFESPHWTKSRGLWCAVSDGRLVGISYRVMKRFCNAHALQLDFAPRLF